MGAQGHGELALTHTISSSVSYEYGYAEFVARVVLHHCMNFSPSRNSNMMAIRKFPVLPYMPIMKKWRNKMANTVVERSEFTDEEYFEMERYAEEYAFEQRMIKTHCGMCSAEFEEVYMTRFCKRNYCPDCACSLGLEDDDEEL